MFTHRFRRPHLDVEQDEFLRSVYKGSFKGLFDSISRRLQCFVKLHVGPLQVDDLGFYQCCERCGYFENVEAWTPERRRLPK